MAGEPLSLRAARWLIFINALVWFLFGLIVILGLHPAMPQTPLVRWAVGGLGLACAASLLALGMMLRRPYWWAFWTAIGVLGLLAVATLLDQVGLADLAVLVIIVSPMILLIKDRAWYLHSNTHQS
jgi:hypothetical protein